MHKWCGRQASGLRIETYSPTRGWQAVGFVQVDWQRVASVRGGDYQPCQPGADAYRNAVAL